MDEKNKEVENMKEFMGILMEVKVSLAEQSGKLDNLLDMKEIITEASDIAKGANSRSKVNAENIKELEKRINNKASKEDIKDIVKHRENTFKNLPSWIALAISLAVFILTYLGGP